MIQKTLSILLFAIFALAFTSCEKKPERAYYYPAPYSETAQGDIGGNSTPIYCNMRITMVYALHAARCFTQQKAATG